MTEDLWVILPEIVLLSMTSIVLIADLFVSKKNQYLTYLLSQVALAATIVSCIYFPYGTKISAFHEQFIADSFAITLKIIILALMIIVVLYSRNYTREREMAYGEFHLLALFSTLGMLFLVSAKSLLMIYLGLELVSLPLYAMVAIRRTAPLSVEAAMKYFILGALASGMLLYGISLLYGLTGSIQCQEIALFLQTTEKDIFMVATFAIVFLIIGFAFKLGAVPFHMWLPDVYQGAPTSVTLLIASAPKIAAFAMAYRLLQDTFPNFSGVWSQILIVLAILSLAIGNITAIVQTDVKRLLGYSTIGHIGFLFLGILVAPQVGYTASMYYIIVYAIVALAGFGVLLLLSSHQIEVQTFDDLKGLAQRSPWLAFIMLLVAFSLAGVPPTVGFYAKFTILSALVEAGFTGLAALAVVFSIIGAYYYIKIVRVMYFETSEVPYAVGGPLDFRIVLSANGLAILALGIVPAPLFMLCQNVFK